MGRMYMKDGVLIPSVTTIISLLGHEKLLLWANAMGFKHKDIKKIKEEKAEFGTIVHSILRKIVDDNAPEPLQPKDDIMAYDINKLCKKFTSEINKFHYTTLYTEKEIISKELGYAGTLDWLCEIDKEIFLYDFKTSKSVKTTMYLQLGAYYKLLSTIDITLSKAGIILVSDKSCSIHRLNIDDLELYAEAFLHLVDFFNLWIKKNDIEFSIVE